LAEKERRPHERSLRNLLLDRPLQLHYALWVTAVSAAIALGLGLVIDQQSTYASDRILASLDAPGMEWLDLETRDGVRQQLVQSDSNLVATMLGLGFVLALGLMAILLVMTHRVAGPLQRISMTFQQLQNGKLPPSGRLRRGDQFRRLFESLGTAQEALRARAAKDMAAAEALIAACEKGGSRSEALDAAVAELRELVVSKRDSMES
jgi:methyl-accepting chemotaxis protein